MTTGDRAGEDWPMRARHAATVLSGQGPREDDSLTTRLIADIHDLFETSEHDRLRTADLIAALTGIEESPWGDWYGKTITAQALSKLLRPFRIKTMTVKVDGETVRGYKREQFEDAFLRVVGVTSVTRVTYGSAPSAGGNASNAGNAEGTGGNPEGFEREHLKEEPGPTFEAPALGDERGADDIPYDVALPTDLACYTGARDVRGSHGISTLYDPLGTDRPPLGWEFSRPSRSEILAALAKRRAS